MLNKNFSTTKLAYKLLKRINGEEIDACFLPESVNRIDEGGLRTKGYLKFSYEIENGKWYACDFRGKRLFKVEPPKRLGLDIKKLKSDSEIIRLPLVTIITVVLNRKNELEETIKSVINQTYPNIEYIIIDGGSTDGTLEIIKKYEDYIDYWVSEPDKGIYDAMNKGILLASGQWINFMNAGDKFYNYEVVEKTSTLMKTDKYEVLYGDSVVNYIRFKRFFKAKDIAYIKYGMPFSHQACFVKSYLHKQFPFDLSFILASDYNFFFNLYKNQFQFFKVNMIIAECQAFGRAFLDRKNVLTEYKKINNNISKLYIAKEYIKGLVWGYILKFL
ncbi:MAG: glycosyltransferase [Aquificae bacterium]|nr:glycosyltransferase [Aquificota bacterium]